MIKKVCSILASFFLAVSFTLSVVPKASAAVDTCVWTGLGADTNFSTAGNWSTCDNGNVPQAGDSLTFPASVSGGQRTANNDFSGGTSFGLITFSGTDATSSNYSITGNAITLTGGITNSTTTSASSPLKPHINLAITFSGTQTISVVGGATVWLSATLNGSGNLTKSGTGNLFITGTTTYTGTMNVTQGILTAKPGNNALGASSAGTTVGDGASIVFVPGPNDFTLAEPFTLSGAGATGYSKFQLSLDESLSPINYDPNTTFTFSGATTLSTNIQIYLYGTNVNMSSVTLGGFTLTEADGSFGTLTINGQQQPAANSKQISITDSQPSTAITVGNNETYIVNGARGATTVSYKGALKGTGTIGAVSLVTQGKLAPGESPGCINTGNLSFVSGSIYEVEIGGATECSGYDQARVTGTVDLGSSTLRVVRFGGFNPSVGQSYKIIDNDVADAITGTFAGISEGGTASVDNYSFRVSYVGGDGNDVVLTLISTPDTGVGLILNNPIGIIATTTFLGGALLVLARRYQKFQR